MSPFSRDLTKLQYKITNTVTENNTRDEVISLYSGSEAMVLAAILIDVSV